MVYGADGVEYSSKAKKELLNISDMGFSSLPVCIAKTQYSCFCDPKLLGRPTNFKVLINDVKLNAGAGFVVALTSSVVTMPGLSKKPAAEFVNVVEQKNNWGFYMLNCCENFILPFEAVSNTEKETRNIARIFAGTLNVGDFVAMFGEVGAGKTAFVRGAAEHFGVDDLVCSPTFSIVNEYMCCNGQNKMIHCDMYRISNEYDLYGVGFFDFFDYEDSIFFAEWCENIVDFLPDEYIKVCIEILTENKRHITISREKKII